MTTVQDVELVHLIVDADESAKGLNRPGMERLLDLVDRRGLHTGARHYGVAQYSRHLVAVSCLRPVLSPDGCHRNTTPVMN